MTTGSGSPINPFGAIPGITIENAKVMEGITFSWAKRFTIAISGTANIVINTTTVDANKLVVVLPLSFQAIGGGPVFIDMYLGTDSDENGTLWEGINRNHAIGGSPQTTVRLNPTINDDGAKLSPEFMIPSNGTPAVSTIGGQTSEDLVFNALKNKYMLRLVNQEAAAINLTMAMSVFEVPPSA